MGYISARWRRGIFGLASSLSLAAAVAVVAGVGPGALGADQPAGFEDPLHGGLDYLDLRTTPDGQPTPDTQKAIVNALALHAAARASDLAQLQSRIPLVVVDDDPFYGTPHSIRSTFAFLTGKSGHDAATIARDFIAAYPSL